MSLDPISTDVSAVTAAWDATMAFLMGVLPPTQSRIERLKIKHLALYQQIRLRMEDTLYNTIKKQIQPKGITYATIVAYVQDADDDLAVSEQNSLICVLCGRFEIEVPK